MFLLIEAQGSRSSSKDQVASRVSVVDLQVLVAGVPVHCGGIASVGTSREHRGKSYARTALQESVRFMQEQSYDISVLFGIPNFYPKFGYASALTDCDFSLDTRNAEAAEARYSVREMEAADYPAVLAIYDKLHKGRSGAVVREADKWTGFRLGKNWTDRVGAIVVHDESRIVGYASYNLDYWRFAINEIGYVDLSVWSTLVAYAAKQALELRLEKIVFLTHPDDLFIEYCQRYGCEVHVTYRHKEGAMARIINQQSLIAKLHPVLQERAQHAGISGQLLLRTDLGDTRLDLGGSHEFVVDMPQWMLIQLLLGYRSVTNLFFESEARAGRGSDSLATCAFPKRVPLSGTVRSLLGCKEVLMPLIEWSNKYSVGVQEFDQQHQRLIGLINTLHDAMVQGKGSDVLAGTLKQLVNYTQTHFTAEEAAMAKYQYPGLEQQRTAHQALIRRINEFQTDLQNGRVGLSVTLSTFLKGLADDPHR